MTEKRILSWKPRFDERSRNYTINGMLGKAPKRVSKVWINGPILDQGQEGACVGFGWTAKTLADPFDADLSALKSGVPSDPTSFAHYVYNEAKKVDDTPGENYEGTSVLAGAKTIQSLGIVKSYSWAFSVDEVINGILSTGPVVLGINWYEGMYEAPGGLLKVKGKLAGGHCILAIGYRVGSTIAGGKDTILLQNSWGPSWGNGGIAEITVTDLAKLLAKQGEACLPLAGVYKKKVTVRGLVSKVVEKLRD